MGGIIGKTAFLNTFRYYFAHTLCYQANPANRDAYGIKNPLQMFKFNSANGGVWRCGYRLDSIQEASVLVHFCGGPDRFLKIARIFVAAAVTGLYVAAQVAVGHF